MPNTGKPSKDCHECRRRRVKCDLGRPECQRCFKIGKKCPGYRDESSLLFRNEDLLSFTGDAAARDRRRSKMSELSEPDSSNRATPDPLSPTNMAEGATRYLPMENLKSMDALLMSSGRSSPPFRTLLEHYTYYAVPIVLAMFSVQIPGYRRFGFSSFLPQLLSKSSDDSPLMMCCQALALAFLANRFESAEAESTRDEVYGRALAATNILISDPSSAAEDETLVSVWLLSLYEIVFGVHKSTNAPGSITWNIHVQGLVELLRLRGTDQMRTEQGKNIFWILSLSAQIQALAAGINYSDIFERCVESFQRQDPTSDLEQVALTRFAKRTSGAIAKIRHRLETDSPVIEAEFFEEVWEEVQDIEIMLNEALYNYALSETVDLDYVAFGNQYRAYFIRVLQFVSDLIDSDRIQKNGTTSSARVTSIRAQIATEVQNHATATIRNVPYVLGLSVETAAQRPFTDTLSPTTRPVAWSDTLRLLWPLRMITARPMLLTQPLLHATEASLHKLSEVYCLRHAEAAFGGLCELGASP